MSSVNVWFFVFVFFFPEFRVKWILHLRAADFYNSKS